MCMVYRRQSLRDVILMYTMMGSKYLQRAHSIPAKGEPGIPYADV